MRHENLEWRVMGTSRNALYVFVSTAQYLLVY